MSVENVEQVLREAGVEIPGLAEALLVGLANDKPSDRQLLVRRTEAAFREGFLTGKRWPKFAPYAADIWRKSEFYARHFAKKTSDAHDAGRYSRYNYE